ncbi:MAG: hypothetical protein ACO1O1_08630 [Adhaeribacter sp.]
MNPPFPQTRPFYYGAAALLYIAVAAVYFHDLLFFLPRGIHEWAQADRLALALSFHDQGLNFFKPATFNLRSAGGITGVEFPLPAYLAAGAGKLLGREHISFCFRLLNTGVVLACCLRLFHFLFQRGQGWLAAVLPGLLLLGSPVFAFYTCNYLPDAVSAALVLWAGCAYLDYERDCRRGQAVACLLLLTLATLLKLSAGIYFIVFSALLLAPSLSLRAGWKQPQGKQLWLLALAGGALVAGYTAYNHYLNQRYQAGVFLARPMPIDSMETLRYILFRIATLWRQEYFSPVQYGFLLACGGLVGTDLFRRREKRWPWLPLLLGSLAGGLIFFCLMGRQFIDHDYYFITPFMPGLVLLALRAMCLLPQLPLPRLALQAVLAATALGILLQGYRHGQLRQAAVYKDFSNYYRYPWMLDGAQALDQAGIPRQARLLVLQEQAPNLALVYFDRRGLVEQAQSLGQVAEVVEKHQISFILMERKAYESLPAGDKEGRTGWKPRLRNDRFVLLEPGPE